MLVEAAGLAALGAISPTALLVAAVFLGTIHPRRTVLSYLAGALIMTAVMAAIVFVALRAGDLYNPHQQQSRYGLRLALGVVLLAAGLYLLRRGQRSSEPGKENTRMISRLITTPGPKEAFIVGVLLYTPSLPFVAAIQVVATSSEHVGVSIAAILLVIVVTLAFVWAPLLLFLLRPERTISLLSSVNGWLRSRGYMLAVGALLIGGVALTINGILGLTDVV